MTNLIPLSYLNESCFLSVNIDPKKFQMVLKLAQEDLSDLIGAEFYNQIVSQYPDSMSTDNSTIYEEYIKDYLAWTTYKHHLKFSQSESTPTGERQFTDENSTVLSDLNLYSKEKNVYNNAKRYADRLLSYLKLSKTKDTTKYPLYKCVCRSNMGFGFSIIQRGNLDDVISVNKTQVINE